jgi:hypothetical protein
LVRATETTVPLTTVALAAAPEPPPPVTLTDAPLVGSGLLA